MIYYYYYCCYYQCGNVHMWKMEKISWLDKVTNEEVHRRVNKERQILSSIWQRKHWWIDHFLRHDGLLHEIIEGRMKDKPTRGKRRIQMLNDLANDGGFVTLKQGADDRGRWRYRVRMSKTCYTAEDYWQWLLLLLLLLLLSLSLSVLTALFQVNLG